MTALLWTELVLVVGPLSRWARRASERPAFHATVAQPLLHTLALWLAKVTLACGRRAGLWPKDAV